MAVPAVGVSPHALTLPSCTPCSKGGLPAMRLSRQHKPGARDSLFGGLGQRILRESGIIAQLRLVLQQNDIEVCEQPMAAVRLRLVQIISPWWCADSTARSPRELEIGCPDSPEPNIASLIRRGRCLPHNSTSSWPDRASVPRPLHPAAKRC